jgi:hypothetical protein
LATANVRDARNRVKTAEVDACSSFLPVISFTEHIRVYEQQDAWQSHSTKKVLLSADDASHQGQQVIMDALASAGCADEHDCMHLVGDWVNLLDRDGTAMGCTNEPGTRRGVGRASRPDVLDCLLGNLSLALPKIWDYCEGHAVRPVQNTFRPRPSLD